jgi:hypothetical protein
VLEDGTGLFGGMSFSGSGRHRRRRARPGSTPCPAGLLTGQLMKFQAIGFDPVTGWFRTNCETKQF